jgi:hypothetical protein
MSSWPQARDRTFRRSSVRDDVIYSGPSRTPRKPGAHQARVDLRRLSAQIRPPKSEKPQVSESNTLRTGKLVTNQDKGV